MSSPSLNPTIAKYFPLANGNYQVSPGLYPLHHDFGNHQDRFVFQIDRTFSHYRDNKLKARKENLDKYYCTHNFTKAIQHGVNRFLISKLCDEYPEIFTLEKTTGYQILNCQHNDEKIIITDDYQLLTSEHNAYADLFDAILMQVQEDIAVINANEIVTCLHLMAPNFWSASDKVGNHFTDIHQPVAGIAAITKNSTSIVQAMIHRGPYVRFAWGLTCDDELNHFPKRSNRVSEKNHLVEQARHFNAKRPKLFLRVERQTINGLANIDSAIFTIRSYLYNVAKLDKSEIQNLIKAINSMTSEQLEYKGLTHSKSAMIEWLTTLL